MKSLLNNRYLLKVSSTSLAKAGWNLTLTRNEALKNNELVSLASSTVLRMIDKINGEDFREKEERIKQLKQEIGLLKNLKNDAKTRAKMIEKQTEFNKLVFMEDYLCVVIDSKKHYDRANKGFIVNGVEYVRLLATSAGVKKNTIVYVSKKCKDTLIQWLNAERDETVKFVPAKLEAYISLACSASIPVSNPNGVLVVHDIETKFKDDVILVDGLNSKRPKVEIVKDYETTLNAFDGGGLILPSLAKRWAEELEEDYLFGACCLRHAFCKGMLNTFDFIQFAEEVANTYEVTDVWGEVHDIRNIEIVLTTSMLKLWDSYSSIGDYLEKASRNNHTFAITKITPKELDNVQSMNYQFLQSLHLSDEDIKELIKPTIEEIDDILNYDYRKSILYLRGMDLKEKTIRNDKGDYTRALMIDKNMLNDPYTYSKIKNNIKNRIDQAKLGVINVKGNFSILSGDPYILCESMFGLEPKGLLKPGEIYSKYWIDRDVKEVGMFRAPTTNKQSNLVRKIASTDEMLKWYKYMNTVTILNAWDNTTAALNGADYDGDTTMTTDNPYVIKGIERDSYPIVCVQGSSSKCIPTERDFIRANKASFGSAIGSITNKGTAMYDVLAKFEEGSKEHEEVLYRLICIQDYQQAEIDKAKGILARPVLKEWYDWKTVKINEEDSEELKEEKLFNQSILADKKPYFFIYNYATLKKEYMDYEKANERVCQVRYGCSVKELLFKKYRTQKEEDFIERYKLNAPVSMTNSTMNKLCWMIEEHYMNVKLDYAIKEFDSDLFKNPTVEYSTKLFNKVAKLKEEYDVLTQQAMKQRFKTSKNRIDNGELAQNVEVQMAMFKEECMAICSNEDTLCNIVVDLCYKKSNKSKQFAWELCGEKMVENLLRHHDYKISYPTKDENGDIEFRGQRFKMEELILCD